MQSEQSDRERTFLTAEWRWLVMVNWVVDPGLLRGRVPAGTELDAWDGRCYVSLVGFRFLKTRVLGVPIPWHQHFDEVNLRFYVRRREGDVWKRGVVFVRELVPRLAIAVVARTVYGEPYLSVPMRHEIEQSDRGVRARYQWRVRGAWSTLEARGAGAASEMKEGSEEEFITEHYWGYTARRDGSTSEYRVAHPRWGVWRASSWRVDVDAETLYGRAFAEAMSGRAASALIADGSAISVYSGRHLRG